MEEAPYIKGKKTYILRQRYDAKAISVWALEAYTLEDYETVAKFENSEMNQKNFESTLEECRRLSNKNTIWVEKPWWMYLKDKPSIT